jgi:hypothetical protein
MQSEPPIGPNNGGSQSQDLLNPNVQPFVPNQGAGKRVENPKLRVCPFFLRPTGCRNGDSCKMLHQQQSQAPQEQPHQPKQHHQPLQMQATTENARHVKVCPYFNKASGCRNGSSCHMLHQTLPSHNAPPQQQQQQQRNQPRNHAQQHNQNQDNAQGNRQQHQQQPRQTNHAQNQNQNQSNQSVFTPHQGHRQPPQNQQPRQHQQQNQRKHGQQPQFHDVGGDHSDGSTDSQPSNNTSLRNSNLIPKKKNASSKGVGQSDNIHSGNRLNNSQQAKPKQPQNKKINIANITQGHSEYSASLIGTLVFSFFLVFCFFYFLSYFRSVISSFFFISLLITISYLLLFHFVDYLFSFPSFLFSDV